MGADELRYVLPVAQALREAGVAVEVYPEATKLKKQFDYAEKKAIPYISINGSNGKVTVKKKTKKGTYKVTVWVKAAGNTKYARIKKKVTFKIKVK